MASLMRLTAAGSRLLAGSGALPPLGAQASVLAAVGSTACSPLTAVDAASTRFSRGYAADSAAAPQEGSGETGAERPPLKPTTREDILGLFRQHNSSMPEIKGSFVEGTVVYVDRKYVHIDVGLKSFLRFFRGQLSTTQIVSSRSREPRSSQMDFRPGDVFKLNIEELEDPFGDVFANVTKAHSEQHEQAVWSELKQLYENGEYVRGRVLNAVNGGFAVGVAGLVAFLPYACCGTMTAQRVGVLQEFSIKRLDDATRTVMLEDPKHTTKPRAHSNMYQPTAARLLSRQRRQAIRRPVRQYRPTRD